ncbi:hypothetical protein COU61_03110, partial [Candidatus Pacearchaeota archaeon CG10_big_fil_rev_8_21_14_0_10_35_13]
MVKPKKQRSNRKSSIKLKPREKIIKSLIENKNYQSIMDLSGATIINYKNTHNIVNQLYPEIITKEKIGNTNLVRINLIPNQEIYNVEDKRTREFLTKNPRIKLIQKDIEEVGYPFMIVLIFGSYVKNTQTKGSDIDLCIISDNKEIMKRLNQSLNLLSLKLEIQEFTTKEFISMIEKTQNNLGQEIIKNNIILYGIENYYNLITKWTKK